MPRISAVLLTVILLSACCVAQSGLDQLWRRATSQPAAGLSNDKIANGLKQALQISTTKAVAAAGRPDGFLKNEAIKILLPERLRKAGKGLRLVGLGPQLDELEVGMNRAAEEATPEAKQILLDALMAMSIDDARHILSDGDKAATEYFRSKSAANLAAAFEPIVHRSLQNVGVARQYEQLAQNSLAAPWLQSQQFDLDRYVVQKTLDGLFYMLGQQEKQIRSNPAAQTTTLLKEVFGGQLKTGTRSQ